MAVVAAVVVGDTENAAERNPDTDLQKRRGEESGGWERERMFQKDLSHFAAAPPSPTGEADDSAISHLAE